jgi:hypothetical protein
LIVIAPLWSPVSFLFRAFGRWLYWIIATRIKVFFVWYIL